MKGAPKEKETKNIHAQLRLCDFGEFDAFGSSLIVNIDKTKIPFSAFPSLLSNLRVRFEPIRSLFHPLLVRPTNRLVNEKEKFVFAIPSAPRQWIANVQKLHWKKEEWEEKDHPVLVPVTICFEEGSTNWRQKYGTVVYSFSKRNWLRQSLFSLAFPLSEKQICYDDAQQEQIQEAAIYLNVLLLSQFFYCLC